MNRPPWLNTRSTGHAENPLKQWLQTDKLLVVPDKAPQFANFSAISAISFMYAGYELTTLKMKK